MTAVKPEQQSRTRQSLDSEDSNGCILISVPQAAKACNVSRSTFYIWLKAGLIPSVRIGRRRLVPPDKLRARIGEMSS